MAIEMPRLLQRVEIRMMMPFLANTSAIALAGMLLRSDTLVGENCSATALRDLRGFPTVSNFIVTNSSTFNAA